MLSITSSKKKTTGGSTRSRPVPSSRSAEFVHSSDDSSYERPLLPISRPKGSLEKNKVAVSNARDPPALPRRPKDASTKPSKTPDSSGRPAQRPSSRSEPAIPRNPRPSGSASQPSASTTRQVNGRALPTFVSSDKASATGSDRSSGEASGSESDDDRSDVLEERLQPSKAQYQKPNGKAPSANSHAVKPSSSNPLKRKRPTPPPSVSTSTSGSEHEDELVSSNDAQSDYSIPTSKTAPSFQRSETIARTPIQYEPPPNFSLATISNVSPTLQNVFSTASLKGKQIWQICIPASVPIDSITSVPVTSVVDGSPILVHDGIEYCLSTRREGEIEGEMVMLPNAEKNRYLAAKEVKISRSLKVHEVPRKPRMSPSRGDDTMAIGSSTGGHEQPKGMKMRYRPFGDYDSDSEDGGRMQGIQHTPVAFQRPNIPNGVPSALERGNTVEKTAKKARKEKRQPMLHPTSSKSTQEEPLSTSQGLQPTDPESHAAAGSNDPVPQLSARKKHKKSERDIFEVASDQGSSQQFPASRPSASSSSPKKHHETVEEKARRREERRKRKKAMKGEVNGMAGII